MSKRRIYRLHDSVIEGIARSLQESMLMGTNIVDHMRMYRLEAMRDDPDTLILTGEYVKQEQENLDRLATQADEMRARIEARKTAEDASEEQELVSTVPDDTLVMIGGMPMTGDGGEHGAN